MAWYHLENAATPSFLNLVEAPSSFQLWTAASDWQRWVWIINTCQDSEIGVDSYHGRLLDRAEAVDENVDSVLHGDSWKVSKRRGVIVVLPPGCLAVRVIHTLRAVIVYSERQKVSRNHVLLYFCIAPVDWAASCYRSGFAKDFINIARRIKDALPRASHSSPKLTL